MKVLKIIPGLFILLISTASAIYAQQQFVHTVSAANKYCNSTCSLIDNSALNNNPNAIIIVTPILVNGTSPNLHPVGTYFVDGKKWSIINADGIAITDNAKFNVQYWANPTAAQFVYVIPAVGVAPCINHAVLNNNSKAQILFSITGSPNGAYFNKEAVKIEYTAAAAKWCVANVNGQPVKSHTAYNIVIISDGLRMTDLTKLAETNPVGTVKSPADIKPLDPACNCPASLPPNGSAGGDLDGTYPNPTVKKLNGNLLSNNAPKFGQTLKWNGVYWTPAEDDVANSGTVPAAPKLSILSFDQSTYLNFQDLNVNTKPIPGLDNRNFTLDQSSRVVFQTVIEARIYASGGGFQVNATGITLTVEILNTANAVVARSTALGWLTKDTQQNFVSVGIGVLPKGTYHTKVTIIRQTGGAELIVMERGVGPLASQGGQMIIQIFPD